MKILKKAQQKNFIVDCDYYTNREIDTMLDNGLIKRLFNDYVVYAINCKEVKVICKDGFYFSVVITKDGSIIHIIL